MNSKKNIAIFASGAGSNALKIIEYFRNHPAINVSLIATNNAKAGVISIAEANNLPLLFLDKNTFFKENFYSKFLKEKGVEFIILAGFLWKIPTTLIDAFPEKIINIHPALLPKYGGKGMYGNHVHQAVIDNAETESGITIHVVDEQYDHGKHIFQAKCAVEKNDNADSLAQKIHTLEHKYFPQIIEKYILEDNR